MKNDYQCPPKYWPMEGANRSGLSIEESRCASLYTNLEPCLMYIGAVMSFFIGSIYYALESPVDGAVGLVVQWQRREEDLPL